MKRLAWHTDFTLSLFIILTIDWIRVSFFYLRYLSDGHGSETRAACRLRIHAGQRGINILNLDLDREDDRAVISSAMADHGQSSVDSP